MSHQYPNKQGDATSLKSARFSCHNHLHQGIDGCSRNEQFRSGKGKVALVGAGPNDTELLTIKALKAIQSADAIVYDRLVNRDILDFAPADCRQVYVGKRCGQPSLKQEEISQILLELAMLGQNVVRLKGGDPFIFGRGGEEGLLLSKHNIDFEVIPGITAAIGCAASSYIPLTHRGLSRSVTFVTGQVVTGSLPAWSQLLAAGQTLVLYMGLEKAQQIQAGLIEHGLCQDFPLAIVAHGCSPQQKVYVSTLKALNTAAQALKGVSPALIILGEVVTLRKELNKTVESVISQEVI
ncbi:uroporphyrinogen-III methyltransferase [Vibrio sinaloensis DSM 21326]|uniref:uroporphyrinogen-III C-methyltransferase n=1 Tax=Vibrio sinaloensis DSM 21326 TaxID=945550 RepID=E8M5B1_PHOS4|nr:uroporphyrinogen-III C-methyltransferase [Vibrio sinaloensis]EGA70704.1 uroporphyrinogen-III methyltransferase [Vibrio sinaloensis DSM 21326]